MAEVTTFSSSGADVISRSIELEEEVPSVLSPEELEEVYDIARTVDEIEKGDYKRVRRALGYMLEWSLTYTVSRLLCSFPTNCYHIPCRSFGNSNPGSRILGNYTCSLTHLTEGEGHRQK